MPMNPPESAAEIDHRKSAIIRDIIERIEGENKTIDDIVKHCERVVNPGNMGEEIIRYKGQSIAVFRVKKEVDGYVLESRIMA